MPRLKRMARNLMQERKVKVKMMKKHHPTMIPSTNLRMMEKKRMKKKKRKTRKRTKKTRISKTTSIRKLQVNHNQSVMISKMLK